MFAHIIAALLTGTSATPATGATATPANPPRPRMVCRTVEQTGTRLGSRRVCRPANDAQQRGDEEGSQQGRDVESELGRVADLQGNGASGSPR